MTREELENYYEYKVTKKALMREFPFVKDMNFKHNEDVNKWSNVIYVNVEINIYNI